VEQVYIPRRLPLLEQLGYPEAGFVEPYVPIEGRKAAAYRRAMIQGDPYALLHADPDAVVNVVKEQEDRPFYVPTAEEIEALWRDGYIHNAHYERLSRAIERYGGDPGIVKQIWVDISTGMEFFDVMKKHFGGYFENDPVKIKVPDEEWDDMIQMLQDCHNSTNMRVTRGWAPEKLMRKLGGPQRPSVIVPKSAEAAKWMREAEAELNAMGITVAWDAFAQNEPKKK
ncbi:MAG: hypothetical protein ACI4XW_12640, partial [Candidatus Spyradocola sp.]